MTENTTPDVRTEILRRQISAIVGRGYEIIYQNLDALHQRGIHDNEVIQALTDLDETDLLSAYAEWAEIVLPDAEPTSGPVMDDVVPDPHDADSYNAYPEPKRRVEEFLAGDLLDRLLRDLPFSSVAQTGGGCATLVFRKSPEDVPLLGGPGAYNWQSPRCSTFHTGEFYYGPDNIGIDGADPKYDEPGDIMDPSWSLEELAEKIKTAYSTYNPEGVTK